MALSEHIKITKVKDATTAGQGAANSSAVDMRGWESVLFIVSPGAITTAGVQSINVAQDVASGGSFTDLLGSKVTVVDDDDNQVFWVEIVRPSKRFVRLEIARATQNSAWGEIYALQFGAKQLPINNNVVDEITGELHVTPTEGTA